MRIAFHAPQASLLESGLSGDRILVASLLAGLRERGHEIRIASRLDVGDVWRSRISTHRLVAEATAVRRAMAHFAPDAWLIFSSSIKYPDLFGWWQRPKRYVIYRTNISSRRPFRSGWRWLFQFAHRRSLARADKVVVAHPRLAKSVGRFGVEQERLSISLPWGRTWSQLPSREEARRHLGLPLDTPVILCVSRLTEGHERNPGKTQMVLNLVAAVARLPQEAILALVGDGRGRKRLEQQACDLIATGRVRVFGAVQDLKWFYAACSFFAFPDLQDRPRLAILEAQGCGRAVVTMRTPCAERTIDPGRTGLLATNLEEFRDHVAALANDRARCEWMGRAAQEYVEKFHCREARITQIEDLLIGQR